MMCVSSWATMPKSFGFFVIHSLEIEINFEPGLTFSSSNPPDFLTSGSAFCLHADAANASAQTANHFATYDPRMRTPQGLNAIGRDGSPLIHSRFQESCDKENLTARSCESTR